jgi:hypothetical protein
VNPDDGNVPLLCLIQRAFDQTCAVVYTPRNDEALYHVAQIGILAACIVGAVLVVVYAIWSRLRPSRSSRG